MRNVLFVVFACAVVFVTGVRASDQVKMDKVKTGIMPSGGFYSLYEVECLDSQTAAIANISSKRRWCSLYEGSMNCFTKANDAVISACMSGAVASSDSDLEATDRFQ